LFKSTANPSFRTKLAEDIFNYKYKHQGAETWGQLAETLVEHVMGDRVPKDMKDMMKGFIRDQKFLPGGRYIYYAGRAMPFFNNCYLLKAEEDTREDWANLAWKAESCLLTGGGIGVDYSVYRPSGSIIRRTGGTASGPIPKMGGINNQGRYIMQGGSRRSAIYASLLHSHSDVTEFLSVKDWDNQPAGTGGLTLGDLKRQDFNFPAPLDMTNISVNYDTKWLLDYYKTGDVGEVFLKNVEMALKNGEPGFSFNFFEKENETLRNACTEVTSADDSDVCNLGSINLSRITSIEELSNVVELATIFLLCGTLVAELPYPKIARVRERNRRLGLGIMGLHEWLIQRGHRYEVIPELHQWLTVYKGISDHTSRFYADRFNISRPVANRAIAPTGTIGILAGTTTGIEPIYAVAYKRRYLTNGTKWKYQYHVDDVARNMIELYGVNPDAIETAADLAADPERRIKFQADVQDYVDMGISSTINLPAFSGGRDDIKKFAMVLASYASRLRGFTCYPDGARGGQPLVKVEYTEVKDKLGTEFEEAVEHNNICDLTGSGYCGL
jgi:ribonucleoside-diphosphate reductase alpha chain